VEVVIIRADGQEALENGEVIQGEILNAMRRRQLPRRSMHHRQPGPITQLVGSDSDAQIPFESDIESSIFPCTETLSMSAYMSTPHTKKEFGQGYRGCCNQICS